MSPKSFSSTEVLNKIDLPKSPDSKSLQIVVSTHPDVKRHLKDNPVSIAENYTHQATFGAILDMAKFENLPLEMREYLLKKFQQMIDIHSTTYADEITPSPDSTVTINPLEGHFSQLISSDQKTRQNTDMSGTTVVSESELTENPFTVDAILARKEVLTSEDIINQFKRYQKYIEQNFKKGDEIDKSDEIPENKAEYIYSEDQLLVMAKLRAKEKSIVDILKEINGNENALNRLINRTVDSLKNAFKISENEIPSFKEEVRDIYTHYDKRISAAHTLYLYYELQRHKNKLKSMHHGLKKCCKQAYYTMSLKPRKNRALKRKLTRIFEETGKLEAEKLRREHLAQKYDELKLEKGGKRGREAKKLGQLMELKFIYERDKAKIELPYQAIIRDVEKLETGLSNKLLNLDPSKDASTIHNIETKKNAVRDALQGFKDRVQYNPEALKTRYILERDNIYQERLIKKFGSHPINTYINTGATVASIPASALITFVPLL